MNHNIHAQYFEINTDGYIRLKSEYRGAVTESHNSSTGKPTTFANAISDTGVGKVGSSYHNLPQSIIIPTIVNGKTVSGLQGCTFLDNSRIVSIIFPATFTTIAEYCFAYCYNLISIENVNNITTLDKCAFRGTQLSSVSFPNVESCAQGVFRQCSALIDASLPKVTTITNSMFYGCDSLERLYMPLCTTIEKNGLKVTNNLLSQNVTLGTLTSVGINALDVSGYSLTAEQADNITFGGHHNVNLYKNRDFVDTWRRICDEEVTEPILLPIKHNFEQDDSMWSETGNGIEWFNWGSYDELTDTYKEYLPDFTYEKYGWTPQYAGALWTDNYISGDNTVTGMGCTLHAMTGAYLGLYNPFKGSTVIENPNLFQQLVIEKTGGRDTDGVPNIIKEWNKSQETCSIGSDTTSTHKYTADYKQNLQKLIYYGSGSSKRVDTNTTYLTTFVANKLGLKCEVVGYNHSDYQCSTNTYSETVDPVANYLSDPQNWDSYLRYIIQSLKEGKYIELICYYGGSQQHAVLMYGVDKDGYVYINNTAHFDYQFGFSRGHCFKVPFENVMTFYNSGGSTATSIGQSTILGSIPLIIFSKKETNLDNLGPSFVRNCEYFIDSAEGVINELSSQSTELIVNGNVDNNILREIADTVDKMCPEDRYIEDDNLDIRAKLTRLIDGGNNE